MPIDVGHHYFDSTESTSRLSAGTRKPIFICRTPGPALRLLRRTVATPWYLLAGELMDLLNNLVFLREKGEESHLSAATKYNQLPGTVYLTNKRILWVPSGTEATTRPGRSWLIVSEGSTTPTLNIVLAIIFGITNDLHSTDVATGHFVSPATHKKALLKVSVNNKGNKVLSGLRSALKREQEEHVFEFTSADAVHERDGFKQFLARVEILFVSSGLFECPALAETEDRRN